MAIAMQVEVLSVFWISVRSTFRLCFGSPFGILLGGVLGSRSGCCELNLQAFLHCASRLQRRQSAMAAEQARYAVCSVRRLDVHFAISLP